VYYLDCRTGILFLKAQTVPAAIFSAFCAPGCIVSPGPWRQQTIVTSCQDEVEDIDNPISVDVAAPVCSAGERRTAEGAADAGQVAQVNLAVIVGITSQETCLSR